METYGNYVAFSMMLSYCIALTWVAINWGNREGARPWTTVGQIVAPTASSSCPVHGWRHIGEVTFSPDDVTPPILQKSPVYERTYASGKKAWRFWDDLTEEWVYHSALPTDLLSS